jgi:hypothetical protein
MVPTGRAAAVGVLALVGYATFVRPWMRGWA